MTDSLLAARVERHRELSSEIDGSSDEDLLGLVSQSDLPRRGTAAVQLPRSGGWAFVKLLPLTALELQPERQRSTANLFGLPTYYQYRIGSCGLGSWRELEAHRLTTGWVLSGQRPHFPLLHGWRVLPLASPLEEDLKSLDRWRNEPAIRRRVEAASEANWSVALFLERFPLTLGQWLRDRLATGSDALSLAEETEARLTSLLGFTSTQGLLHMDAHFENILTDGSELYLGDFGLAISRAFCLDDDERAFFERHRSFDLCTALTSNVHAIVAHYDSSSDDWREPLRAMLGGSESRLDEAPAGIRTYLAERGPLALALGDFYRRLISDLATEYPDASLLGLLDQLCPPAKKVVKARAD